MTPQQNGISNASLKNQDILIYGICKMLYQRNLERLGDVILLPDHSAVNKYFGP